MTERLSLSNVTISIPFDPVEQWVWALLLVYPRKPNMNKDDARTTPALVHPRALIAPGSKETYKVIIAEQLCGSQERTDVQRPGHAATLPARA